MQKLKEHQVQKYIASRLAKTGYSHSEIKRTPLGEKIIIYTTRPGLVVGGRGENIQNLTSTLKRKFKMENPQIEIGELKTPMLDVYYVCDRIVATLERFGASRFKSIGYKTLQNVIDSGALGAEIIISGKVPGARAKTWRFSAGHLKKSGDISENYVARAYGAAQLKSGVIGIKVSIMLPDTPMPDKIEFIDGGVKVGDVVKEIEPKKEELDKTIKVEEVEESAEKLEEEKVEEKDLKKVEKPEKKASKRKKKE